MLFAGPVSMFLVKTLHKVTVCKSHRLSLNGFCTNVRYFFCLLQISLYFVFTIILSAKINLFTFIYNTFSSKKKKKSKVGEQNAAFFFFFWGMFYDLSIYVVADFN